ncbi:hypothetical protein [Staphylococcus delphini]|uniref:hypothetical protein n=1 Tax=Staphylococcus delphini TaxID=53344 RepID=UPI000BBCBEC4|nr:hypothetical protein [Staphylococcus delphini]PCF79312.1 hypothetical protein B4W69_13105 [Staphylococcus delphini]
MLINIRDNIYIIHLCYSATGDLQMIGVAGNEVVYLTKDINNSILEKVIVFDRDNRLINENELIRYGLIENEPISTLSINNNVYPVYKIKTKAFRHLVGGNFNVRS